MAAGVMKNYFQLAHLQGVIESAGTEDWNVGRGADVRAIHTAKLNGIDISSHRARQVMRDDFDRFDFILAMDRANLGKLRAIAPTSCNAQLLLLAHDEEILDPYHRDDAAFAEAFATIQQRCREHVERLFHDPVPSRFFN